MGSLHRGGTRGISLVENILHPRIQGHAGSVLFNCGNQGKRNATLYGYPVKTCFQNNSSDLVAFLKSTGQMLFLPGRHIPIDTSLCSQSPQVRIYGFVAAGINTLRADKKQRNQQTFKQTTHSTVWSFQLHWFIIALLLLGVQTTMDNTVTLIRLNMAQLSLHVGLSATKICINIKKFSLFQRSLLQYLKNKSTRWVSILSCIFHFSYLLRLLQCGGYTMCPF